MVSLSNLVLAVEEIVGDSYALAQCFVNGENKIDLATGHGSEFPPPSASPEDSQPMVPAKPSEISENPVHLVSPKTSRVWCTDGEVSNANASWATEPPLEIWEEIDVPNEFDGTIEEKSGGPNIHPEHWDQFEANERLLGITSTFEEDLSQYTTALDIRSVPPELQELAEKITQDIREGHSAERVRMSNDGQDGMDYDVEETLFASASSMSNDDEQRRW